MAFRRIGIGVLAAIPGFGGTALAQDAPPNGYQVDVRHAAARLVVLAEPRDTTSVTVQHGPSRLPPLSVQQLGDRIVVDGGLDNGPAFVGGERVRCVGGLTHGLGWLRDDRGVVARGVGRVRYADLPVITVHIPLNARIATGAAVWGEIGATDGLSLHNTGCGDWRIGDVRGALTVQETGSGDVTGRSAGTVRAHLAGSGDLSLGAVGPTMLSMAGSGDVRLGPVRGGLRSEVAGSGDVSAASVDGPIRVSMAASGAVRIGGGHAADVTVQIAGSGDFVFRGVADRLSASIVGSGDVHVARVAGTLSKSVMGSGEVTVGP